MVPRVPLTPTPVGVPVARSGGHAARHWPVQALVPEPFVSLVYMYNAMPLASTTTDPSDVVAVLTVAPAAGVEPDEVDADVLAADVLLALEAGAAGVGDAVDPHADRARVSAASGAAAPMTRRRDVGIGAPSVTRGSG
jgi:hypothetical protein